MRSEPRKTAAAGLSAALTLIAALAGCESGARYAEPPPPKVAVSHPVRRPVKSYVEYTGTTRPVETVDLRARVKGFLRKVNFKDGDAVQADQVLMVIEEDPYRARVEAAKAKLDEAQATLARAKQSKSREVAAAQLALDQAMLALSQVEERRNRALLARNAASREDIDKSEASTKKSAAQVEADRANLEQVKADFETGILAAQAQVEAARSDLRNAEIDLAYCTVKSPIDGTITRKLVDLGNLVGDGEATVLATVVKTDPIYAYMTASEADLLRFREMVRKGERVDFRKETLPVDLGLMTEGGFPHHGRMDYVDPGLDPATGTITARAVFPNPKREILPGLFARVRIPLRNESDALLVAERSIGSDPQGRFVLVVGPGNKLERRKVVPGEAVGDLRVITEGLKPDDLVVMDDARARAGLVVEPEVVPPPAGPSDGPTAESGGGSAAPAATKAQSPAAK